MKLIFPTTSKRAISWIFIVLIMFYSVGCKYFKVKQVDAQEFMTIYDVGKVHKDFFIHQGDFVYSLFNIQLDSLSMSGQITTPAKYHLQEGRSFRMMNHETNILNEVHIYLTTDSQEIALGQAQIPFSSIQEILITDKDSGKTAASFIFGGIGIILGVFVIITVIVMLTKSSCPYVYTHDGEGFVFEGEIYGGAIAQNLQREDYLPLKSLNPKDDFYKIRISNELKEQQYTDLAELIVVEHEKNERVLLDKQGSPHLITDLRAPLQASSYSGFDLLPSIEKMDSLIFFFNDEYYSRNGIVLKFDKPAAANEAKLVINSKNSLWFDYQFGEFLSKFGCMYDSFMEKQAKVPQEEREQLGIDNDFPLSIYLKLQDEWVLVDRLNTIGPLASRDFVIPVDLSGVEKDYFEIKLETGFMFWEVDFAGIDFTTNQELDIKKLKPFSANGTGSNDWVDELANIDHKYMAQEETGDIAELIYRTVAPKDNKIQSYFLHTSGYYELVREFEGLPQIIELNKFKNKGYFSDFSRANYLKLVAKEQLLARNN